ASGILLRFSARGFPGAELAAAAGKIPRCLRTGAGADQLDLRFNIPDQGFAVGFGLGFSSGFSFFSWPVGVGGGVRLSIFFCISSICLCIVSICLAIDNCCRCKSSIAVVVIFELWLIV